MNVIPFKVTPLKGNPHYLSLSSLRKVYLRFNNVQQYLQVDWCRSYDTNTVFSNFLHFTSVVQKYLFTTQNPFLCLFKKRMFTLHTHTRSLLLICMLFTDTNPEQFVDGINREAE